MPPRQYRNPNPALRRVSSRAMSRSPSNSKRRRQQASATTLAKALAPEEIRPGAFVAVLYEIVEWPSWIWCDDATLGSREEVVRMCVTPRDAAPLEVCAVCLPFVLVREPCRRERIVDIRRQRLARLDNAFARAARRACRRALKKRYRARAATAVL